MGGVGNGIMEEDPAWDLNKKAGSQVRWRQCGALEGPCGSIEDERTIAGEP